MDTHLANLFRRSRPHQRAVANMNNGSLVKKDVAPRQMMNPERLSEIAASESRDAAQRAGQVVTTGGANPATPVTAGVTEAVGGAPSRVQTVSSAPATSAASPSPSPAASSSTPSSSSRSSASSSSARPSSSSSSARPTTSSTPTTTSTSTSSRSVMTVTTSRSSSSTSSSPSSSASAAAASQSTSSDGLSTGAIAGIALATLVGLVILGSALGWLYRKHAQRKYSTKAAPWSKLDDDVTPFPPGHSEKPYLEPEEDIYGQSQAPVIGSRRALAKARDNAFYPDGSLRPNSDYMIPRDGNRAGLGAMQGLGTQYGAYPAMHSPGGYDYGRPAPDYGYDNARTPSPISPSFDQYGHNQPGMAVTAPGNTRQLVGPGGHPQPYGAGAAGLAPVAMGRPAPPQSASDFADREEFMDLPMPTPAATGHSGSNSGAHLSQYSTYGLAYADTEPDYTPHTATTTGWAGDVKAPPQSATAPNSLPAIEPASPLMSGFDFQKRQSQPLGPIAANFASKYGGPGDAKSATLPMYEDEDDSGRQKRMYGEVAHAAGVMEPTTPHTADLNHSTNSHETSSSFSAHDPSSRSVSTSSANGAQRLPKAPLPPLPIVNLTPPQPYQHGQPLSPLPEVETPASTVTGGPAALTSSSLMHGQEVNPFERAAASDQTLLATPRVHALRPPNSAVSSTGATSFPSPSYPPPSPGGMSVPGSVTDSPRHKRESIFDGEDAYGGI